VGESQAPGRTGTFDEEWRQQQWQQQQVWHSAVQLQGLEGLEMLRPGGVDQWQPRLEGIRAKIEALDTRNCSYNVVGRYRHTHSIVRAQAGRLPRMISNFAFAWFSKATTVGYQLSEWPIRLHATHSPCSCLGSILRFHLS
jgi:hypothetical protein